MSTNLVRACVFSLVTLLAVPQLVNAKIDATKGRRYGLSKKHGPWMIMVASLHRPPKERQKADSLGPQEAADLLVYELRKRGIPAYTYKLSSVKGELQTQDRSGRQANRIFRAQEGGICVLAGNYKNLNDRVAQNTLKWIKSFKPNLWEDRAFYKSTPGQRGPLGGAFLTINPVLSPEEIARKKRNPLLLRLNGDDEFSILKNRGKYTVVVGTFGGRSQTSIGGDSDNAFKNFRVKDTLDEAAMRAWKTARLLRTGLPQGQQKGRKFDAFVFHDRYRSMVTIGEFDSPNDPRIAQITKMFGAKLHPGTNGKPYMTGEAIVIPGQKPETVIFDPKPRVIAVPRTE